ncbi:MAG: cell division protein ZapA [Croceibacterium sp.]
MSNVTLSIAGRSYTVACAAGEESHVAKLGTSIDGKVAGMQGSGQQSEARTLLYAALLLADELHDAQQGGPTPPGAVEDASPLDIIADRLEELAARLEGSSWKA